MFTRKILAELRSWAKRPTRKPLVLRGARQVGKTTVVQIFSSEFDHFIKLNLELPKDRSYFESGLSLGEITESLFLNYNINISGSTKILIFIDEIQYSAAAINMLRYFYEERKDLFVIAAGSMLETAINFKAGFPVGRVEYLRMHPCTFEEFLIATDEEKALEVLDTIPAPEYAWQKLSDLFKIYSIIGGMPEVVATYAHNKEIHSLTRIYESLIVSIMDDVEKYARNDTLTKIIRHTLSHSFTAAGSRIKFQGFGSSGYKNREIKEAFQSLQKAFILQLVYPVNSTVIPLHENLRRSPKLQMMDTGMVTFSTGVQKDILLAQHIDDVYQGRVAEHIVGQELQSLSASPLYQLHFWTREKADADAEVDFVFQHSGKVVPVEVKSGATGRLRSLIQFMEHSPHQYAVRVFSGRLNLESAKTPSGKPFYLLNLPFYLVHRLPDYLVWMINEVR